MKKKIRSQKKQLTDEKIAVRALKDNSWYGLLVEKYEKKMFRYVKRISGVSNETAEDLVQDIFLKVYMNLDRFNRKMKFSSWIYRIAYNETISYWRRNRKRMAADISLDGNDALRSVLKDSKHNAEFVYQGIMDNQLRETVLGLDEKYREVILMKYYEGKSCREISDLLHKPLGTVTTILNRGRMALKKELVSIGVYA